MTRLGSDRTSRVWTKQRRARALLFAALAICFLACRDRGAGNGAGGQSGDEGRKASWLGTGGVASELRLLR